MLDISEEKLDAMAAVDIRTVDINTLTDIRDIKIDTKLPVEENWLLLQDRQIISMSIVWETMWLRSDFKRREPV